MGREAIFGILLLIWYILWMVQGYLGFGTAYRYTKRGGDNGVSLFGWLIVFQLASIIPLLGIYLWDKSKSFNIPTKQVTRISATIAGWYPDPSGAPNKLRFWSGTAWTEDTKDIFE